MPEGIEIAENAYLAAVARFEKWREEFERQWGAPHAAMAAAMGARKLQNLPEEVQAMSREQEPEAWKQVDELANIEPEEV